MDTAVLRWNNRYKKEICFQFPRGDSLETANIQALLSGTLETYSFPRAEGLK